MSYEKQRDIVAQFASEHGYALEMRKVSHGWIYIIWLHGEPTVNSRLPRQMLTMWTDPPWKYFKLRVIGLEAEAALYELVCRMYEEKCYEVQI